MSGTPGTPLRGSNQPAAQFLKIMEGLFHDWFFIHPKNIYVPGTSQIKGGKKESSKDYSLVNVTLVR